MALVNLNNMNDQKIILDVKNLTVQFKTPHGVVKAVNNISFDLKKGETLGILGESGSGKTVTIGAITGLLETPPAEVQGNVIFDSINLSEISPRKMQTLRGKRISLIHQDPVASLNPLLTSRSRIRSSDSLAVRLGCRDLRVTMFSQVSYG